MVQIYADNPPRYFPPPFQNNSVNAEGYSVRVTDGTTTIFRKGRNSSGTVEIVNIGSIKKGGGFTNTGNASKEEIQYFTANARKTVNDQAVPVVRRGIGGTAGGGNSKINEVLGTNISSTPPQQPQPQQGSTPTPGVPTGIVNPDKTDLKFAPDSGLRYPFDIGSNKQDRIKFRSKRITGRNLPQSTGNTGSLTFTLGDPKYEYTDGPVYLAIQAPISDQNTVDWGPDSMNPINAQLYNEAMGAMGGNIQDRLQTVMEDLYKTASEYQGRIQRYLGGQAASINNILARTDAVVLNPNLELLFNGPQLRPFNFTFKMSARDEGESKQIIRIINYFKYHMSVRKEDQLFLKAPHVFDIQYQYGNSNSAHQGLNLIKECALTNLSVDYTPLGSYMTYQDGTMVAYTLNMQFQEILPVYDTDYTENQQIGY